MGFEAAGDVERVFAVRFHAQGERFDATQHQPAVHRAGNRAGMHHHVVQRFRQFFGFNRNDAHQYVGVAAKVFSGGVEHDVAAHLQRLLQIRRSEGVVDADQCAGCVGFGGKRFDVHQPQKRIGRGFQPNQFHIVRGKQFVQAVGGAQIGKDDVHAPLFIYVNQQVIRAAVNIGYGDDGIARTQEGTPHGINARHTAGKGKTRRPAFQIGNRVFQNLTGRIAQARIAVGNLLADFVQREHTVLINRRHQRAVVFVAIVAGMDGFGGEFHLGSTL